MKITRSGFLRLLSAPLVAGGARRAQGDSRKRWAMAIDDGKCMREAGCSACVQACHRAHNVPAIPDKRHEVKWVWKERWRGLFGPAAVPPAAVDRVSLAMCNHCDNPPCTRVCPTGATWKRADGIVMMDWHRCIGCRYCMAACPYGSRSFNWVDPKPYLAVTTAEFPRRTKGVVEKCNFCEERLAAGKAPACVEACAQRALIFGNADDPQSEVRKLLDSRYTIRRHPELGTKPSVYYVIG
jgi:[DsrC]-trisulfide reductase subunit O